MISADISGDVQLQCLLSRGGGELGGRCGRVNDKGAAKDAECIVCGEGDVVMIAHENAQRPGA